MIERFGSLMVHYLDDTGKTQLLSLNITNHDWSVSQEGLWWKPLTAPCWDLIPNSRLVRVRGYHLNPFGKPIHLGHWLRKKFS
jgi:hypothetical protein